MKIFDVDSHGRATLIADSAWRPDRRPYFPDLERYGQIDCVVRPAIRIDRLGKNIPERFAGRYVGAWAIAAVNKPKTNDSDGAPWNVLDDTVILGPWRQLPEVEVELRMSAATATWRYDPAETAKLVSRLSDGCTFKTGDVIILPRELFRVEPQPGTHVRVHSDDIALLDFNIK